MSSRHAAAAARLSGNRHAREARALLVRGGAFERAGRHDRARIAFMDALAHAGGTLASLPLGATGYVSEEESDLSFERYQTDPGAILVELQEGYQLETLWHERNNRLYALISLASAALETGKARQALDAARRASVNVLHQGDFHGRAHPGRRRPARARALALSEEQEQPTTRPRSESLLARGLEAPPRPGRRRINWHFLPPRGRSCGCTLSRGFKLGQACARRMYSDVGKGNFTTGGSAAARR